MSDRLDELRRQRALAAEEQARLDREIAAASGEPAPAPTPASAAGAPAPQPVNLAPPVPPQVAAEAERILEQYRVAPDTLKTDVKKGCFLYFFAALALVGLAVVAFYFSFHHGQ